MPILAKLGKIPGTVCPRTAVIHCPKGVAGTENANFIGRNRSGRVRGSIHVRSARRPLQAVLPRRGSCEDLLSSQELTLFCLSTLLLVLNCCLRSFSTKGKVRNPKSSQRKAPWVERFSGKGSQDSKLGILYYVRPELLHLSWSEWKRGGKAQEMCVGSLAYKRRCCVPPIVPCGGGRLSLLAW